MALTIKHAKTDTIADWTQSDLDAQIALGNFPAGTVLADIVLPSDWNDDHTFTGTLGVSNGGTGATTLTGYVTGNGTSAFTASATIPNTAITGLGSMSTQNSSNVSITGGSISGTTVSGYIPTTEKGAALGVATLDAGGKVPTSQIPLQGDLNYQGTWNASTNTPTLTSSVGTQGYYYVVNVAGTTNLNGITDWQVGDWAIYNGTVWQKVDNTDAVSSVNGQTGTVVLTTTNIAEGTNEYFTQARARTSVSAGTGISYDNLTGVITNSSPSLGGDVVGPASATDNAIARFDTTTGKLIQNSVVTVSDAGVVDGVTHMNNVDYIDFDTTYATTLSAGQLGWNGNDTLGLGMIGGNVVQHIGEDTYFYVKASATITKGQLCMFTGAVGSSGVLTAAPATAIPFAEAIIGVAAENIANNAFGLIQNTGTLKGVDTSAFLDGDVLYYNSAVTGGFTKTFPTSGPIIIAAAVAKSGSGGSGILTVRISFQTRVTAGTAMSVTQGNDVVTINNTGVTSAVAGTGISVSGATGAVTITNTAPDQVVSITGAGTTTVTGTYPNFTVSSDDQFDGTVTSVSGTGTVNGISLSGTVTSSGNLTLGGTLSNVSLSTQVTGTLPIANGGTGETTRQAAMDALAGAVTSGQYLRGNGTDVVMSAIQAADVPTLNQNTTGTASNVTGTVAVANGGTGLTSLTANRVPYGNGTSAYQSSANLTFDGTTLTATDITDSSLTSGRVTYAGTGGNLIDSSSLTYNNTTGVLTSPELNASNGIIVNSKTVSTSYSIPSGSSAMSTGPITVASGVNVTVASGSRWVVL